MSLRNLLTPLFHSPAKPGEMLTSLQAGRAFAALLVLLFHNSHYIFELDKYWGYDPTLGMFSFAQAGVMFFFVLSGFIIAYIHGGELGRPGRFAPYARKRFIRIYPFYWLVLAGIIPIYFLIPSFGFDYHREVSTILSSFLLIHFDERQYTALAVAWTLYHEVLFYLLFGLAILHRQLGSLVIGAWLAASVSTLVFGTFSFPLAFLFSHVHVLFGMGVITCWALGRGHIRHPKTLFWLGLALFLATAMEDNYAHWLAAETQDMFYGLGSALMVAGAVTLERAGRLRVPALLTLMGNASYSIYLTHFTALSLLAKVFIALGMREMLPAWVSYIALAAITVAMGIIVHLIVERPLLALLGRRLGSRSAPQLRTASLGAV